MDKAAHTAHARLMWLGQAIKREAEAKHLSFVEVAARADYSVSQLSRLANGHQVSITADAIARIEAALGMAPGALFIAAGYVTLPLSVEESILLDPRLDPPMRQFLSDQYRAAVASAGPSHDSA